MTFWPTPCSPATHAASSGVTTPRVRTAPSHRSMAALPRTADTAAEQSSAGRWIRKDRRPISPSIDTPSTDRLQARSSRQTRHAVSSQHRARDRRRDPAAVDATSRAASTPAPRRPRAARPPASRSLRPRPSDASCSAPSRSTTSTARQYIRNSSPASTGLPRRTSQTRTIRAVRGRVGRTSSIDQRRPRHSQVVSSAVRGVPDRPPSCRAIPRTTSDRRAPAPNVDRHRRRSLSGGTRPSHMTIRTCRTAACCRHGEVARCSPRARPARAPTTWSRADCSRPRGVSSCPAWSVRHAEDQTPSTFSASALSGRCRPRNSRRRQAALRQLSRRRCDPARHRFYRHYGPTAAEKPSFGSLRLKPPQVLLFHFRFISL